MFAAFSRELHTDDPVPEPERWEREMMPGTFFLEDVEARDGPCAYAFVEEYGERGYVRHVVVRADRRGRGVGRELMRAIARRFRDAGVHRWELNVKRDNAPAIALYESLGMRTVYSTVVTRIDWTDVACLDSPRGPALVAPVRPEDDAAIERRFGLPAGQVARLRAAPDDVLRRLVDARGDVVGFARLNPSFPGCFPFRVADPRHARTLLDALRAFVPPVPPWLQLVIEDDAATAAALDAAGARRVFEILHLEGPVPDLA